MKQTFNFLTLSRVFNDCRDSVGRLSTLILLLFALSFGFSSQAWGGYSYSNLSNAKVVGTMPTCSWESNYGWQLNSSDKNKWDGNFYIPYSSSNYEFQIWLKSEKDNWDGNRANNGFWFTSDNKEAWTLEANKSNMQIKCIDRPTSGYIKVFFEFYGSYSGGYGNDSKLWVQQWAVDPLDGQMNPTSTSVSSGSSLNMNPSISGGSGSYNKQYSASSNIGSFDGDNYKAPMVLSNTSVTITLEVSDANGQLSDLAHKTITKTITVTPPTGDLYIKHGWGDGTQGSWSWQKMEKVSNGNYRFSGNYGGTGCNINTTNNDEGAKYIDNTSGLVVQNTPALDDKCWFTLSYSAGTLTIAPKTYTLTLDGNGGTQTLNSAIATYGKTINISTFDGYSEPTKTGYNYGGYGYKNQNNNLTKVINKSGDFASGVSNWTTPSTKYWIHDEDVTLYAIWTANNYTVRYDANGGQLKPETTMPDQKHTYDEDITLTTNNFERTGYSFLGWSLDKNATSATWTDGQTVKNISTDTKMVYLYAIWSANSTTITLNRNYTDGGTHNITATYDAVLDASQITSADVTRTGYTFADYWDASTGGYKVIRKTETSYEFPASGTYSSSTKKWQYDERNLTAYAHWTANQYTLTLNDNGGTGGSETTQVTFDAKPANVNVPTKVVSEIAQIFTGYYYNDVQIFNNSGAIVLNAGNGTYTDNSGNWKYDGVLTLTAKWEAPAKQKVYFGVTNGTEEDETSGTVSAIIKSTSVAINSGDEIDAGTVITITFSAKQGQYINNNGWKIASWWDGENFATAHKLADAAGNSTSYDYTIPTKTSYVYAYAPEVTNTFAVIVNPEQTRMGSVDPAQGTAGPNVMQQITATPNDGYSFVNWTQTSDNYFAFVEGTSATDATAKVALKNQSGQTITANFKINTYSITYNGLLDGSTHAGNPETYTIESETITFNPATSVFGHKFTSWSQATISTGSTGDQTITAQYGDVTLSAVASANIIEGKQATITPTLTAPPSTYYYQYTCASIATFNVGANGVATFDAPAAGNYTITLNVYEGASNTGVLLATTNVNITVNEDLSANWYIVGQSGLLPLQTDNWVRSENYRFSKPSKDAKSAYIDLVITEGQVNNTYEFKLQDCGQNNDPMYGWGTNGNYRTFEKTTTYDIYTGTQDNLRIIPKMAGTYRFSIDWSGGHNLTVTYPAEGHHMVTVDNGKTQTQVQVNEFTETSLETSQYLNGMRFDRWVVTNAAGDDKSGSITINHSGNYSTHMHGATEDGLIVRATYTTQGIVYLNKQYIKNNWAGDVYVYFYKGAYWDEGSKGSGSKTGDKSNCISTGKLMTRVSDKSDIYYYDYSGDNLSGRDSHIAFLDQREDGYDNFVACQAIYRGDFQECSPMFVPRDWKSYYNEGAAAGRAVYYQEGYWRTYGSTNAGLSLVFWKGSSKIADVPFVSENINDNTFKATVNITDAIGDNSYFKLRCCGGDDGNQDYWYGCKTGMSATSCTNYRFYSGNNSENANCGIGLTSTGDYVFTLSLADGQVFVSVEYPLSNGDYRLVSVTNGKVHDNGMFYKQSTDRVDTASFFITNAHTSLVKLQECTNATAVPAVWADVAGKSINTSEYATGIYNFTFTQSSESSKEIANLGEYTGDFYIRTAIAAGGWDAYKGSADNLLPYIEYGLDNSQPFKFTHAYTNWVDKGKNAKYCIANDYSLCISDTLAGDDIIGTSDGDDWLNKEGANIRFMWNKNTNEVKRAYIGGSTDDAARFLMLLRANGNMYNSSDVAIAELKFTDKNNWVYQADIKAEPGCAVKLTANYNAHTQYFIGDDGDGAGSRKTIINSSTTGDTKHYTMRAVYDFKTNRLTAGWIPDDGPISSQIELGGDMLISRTHQGNAQQITFGTGGEVSEIQHIYGVLTLQKDVMAGTEGNSYNDKATNANYDKTMYWISFPFDVNISEIFGVDGYGKKWIMQKYRGDLRAQKGWFAETSTFWEYMDISEKLNAYEGYLFIVDANYFNTLDADVWKSSATEANFYFPSAEKNIGIINKSSVDIDVPAHECKINRWFGEPTEDHPEGALNHTITDSHWNVIGVPAFQNSTASAIDGTYNNFKSYYAWDWEHNTYNAQTTLDNSITFNTMQAYMVQYAGKITWDNVSVVKKAPYAYADNKNYMIELFFNGNGAEDHTYINLADEASTDFVLNEDMMKLDNAGYPNIYSFAGNYNVAYNETKMTNQSVTIGVSAPKDGSYTFSMPKDFSGSAILVDLEEGTTTDLNVSNYSVDLNKGTYNNRFQLMLEVEAKIPTNIQNANGEWNADGKTKKLLINDQIYLINGGRIYNATGTKVK